MVEERRHLFRLRHYLSKRRHVASLSVCLSLSRFSFRWNEMRLMDADDRKSPLDIRLNSTLRLLTIFKDTRIGKVVAFDPTSNLVTLRENEHSSTDWTRRESLDMRASKSHLTSVAVINLHHCLEWHVEQEAKDETLEPLFPIDMNKVRRNHSLVSLECRSPLVEETSIGQRKREEKRSVLRELESHSDRSISLSRHQEDVRDRSSHSFLLRSSLFRMNQVIRWSNNDILINNTVRIVEPYRSENVSIDSSTSNASQLSAKSDNDTKTHVMKLVSEPTDRKRRRNQLLFLGGQILVGTNETLVRRRVKKWNKDLLFLVRNKEFHAAQFFIDANCLCLVHRSLKSRDDQSKEKQRCQPQCWQTIDHRRRKVF